ncbi:MAG: DoxX family protein [Longimicrobiales bacterium]|nr:DoxX family protein [Longimicrobiales bacterium]
MSNIAVLLQIVIALGIVNVWILRRDRATRFRPDGAANIAQEFARYGLSDTVRRLVGGTKLALAALLLIGIAYPVLAVAAAAGIAVLMAGAVGAHIKVRDPLMKFVPALLMLAMSTVVLIARLG